jgi:ferritin
MMINDKVAKLLSEQVGHELKASSEYLAIAIYFGGLQLDGFKAFFLKQSAEERDHALKIVNFLIDVDYVFNVPAIKEAKPGDITAPLEAVKKAFKWEQGVTQQFREMATLAHAEKDYISAQFVDWFLNEQIEEENSMDRLVKILESGINVFHAESLIGG